MNLISAVFGISGAFILFVVGIDVSIGYFKDRRQAREAEAQRRREALAVLAMAAAKRTETTLNMRIIQPQKPKKSGKHRMVA